MKQVKKNVLLWYSPSEMYRLVTDVPSYPMFLPWCAKTEVLDQDGLGMTARMHMAYGGVHQAFTTRNTHVTDSQVHMKLVDGPFSHLEGTWKFLPLPVPAGSGIGEACKIDFELSYSFSSRALDALVSPVFDKVASTLVDRFVARAEKVYGPR